MEQCVDSVIPLSNRHRVKQLCATRWVERHDAVISFIILYPAIQQCLERCSDELNDAKAVTTARMILLSIQQSEFMVALSVLGNVLSVTHGLAEKLQSVQIDLLNAMSYVNDVIVLLERKRQTADSSFAEVWQQAGELAEMSETEIKCPRVTSRQRNRANAPADCPEQYYNRTVYIPFLDHVINDMKERFSEHKRAIFCLSSLIPAIIDNYTYT
jgi:hypothetical protein